MRFPLSLDLMLRMPRHPDWKYELVDGEAWLSPSGRPLGFVRRTDAPVAVEPAPGPEVRPIEADADRGNVAALLAEVWADEDPYHSLDAEDRDANLAREIERSTASEHLDGAIAVDEGVACACVLVSMSVSPRTPTPTPTLTWLTVRRDVREQGLATALLAEVVTMLADRGCEQIASWTSAANLPSLRWHLERGFVLTPDPLREALRERG